MAAEGLACRRLGFERPGGLVVLDQVEAEFAAGRIAVVTGCTGAGKSTLLHLLAGLLRPTGGQVWAAGQPVSRWRAADKDRWRRRVGIVFQHLALLSDQTVLDNVILPLIPRGGPMNRHLAQVREVLIRLDLAPLADQRVLRLSGGQQQRVALARAMVHQPDFLLLDEPSAFQDNDQTRRLLDQLRIAAGRGACVVISSHDHRLVSSVAGVDSAFCLQEGRLERTK